MWPVKSFLFTIINYFLRITKDQREKAAAFPRASATRPSVKSKSVASCSGYEIVTTDRLARQNTNKRNKISRLFRLKYLRVAGEKLFVYIHKLFSADNKRYQRGKAAAFPRAIVTRPSVKSKSVASCSGYEIALIHLYAPCFFPAPADV